MANTIYDIVTAPAIAAYWNETASNRIPYLGEELFPVKKKMGLDLSWMKGYKGTPIALKPSSFDAKAELRDRIGVTKIDTEMPFFREAMLIKEKDRQELLKLQEAAPAYYQTFISEIFDDRANLISGALVQNERMRMQLLQGGKINITAAGVSYTYDFDESGEYAAENIVTLAGTDVWTDHDNSDPIADLNAGQDAIEEKTGTRPSRAIMTSETWSHIKQNNKILLNLNPIIAQSLIVSDSVVKQFILDTLGLTIAIYNKKYRDEKGASGQFYPNGYVTLMPDGSLGSTWFGTTPEEADLMSGGTDAQVEVVNTGIAVTTIKEPHPVNVSTVVSEIALPSFERMDETYIIKAY